MNTTVDFTTAKLLKEKGFDKSLDTIFNTVYDIEDMSLMKNVHHDTLIKGKGLFLHAPTIAEVVMWLYEKHGIWITVTSISQESWQCHMCKKGDTLGKCYLEDFYTPIEAYEAAIEYTLKNLI